MSSVEERLARYYKAQQDIRQTIHDRLGTSGSSSQKSATLDAKTPTSSSNGGVGGLDADASTAKASTPIASAASSATKRVEREPVAAPEGPVSPPAQEEEKRVVERRPAPPSTKTKKVPTKPTPAKAAGNVILVMTVEISEGVSDTIEVKENDSPVTLAQNFCAKNSLPDKVVGPLTAHIENNLSRVLQQRSVQSTPEVRRPQRLASAPSSGASSTFSKAKASGSRSPDSDLHDRLHKHAKEKEVKLETIRHEAKTKEIKGIKKTKQKMSWVSQQMTMGRNVGEYENYGERLYVEGILNKERRLELEAKYKREKEEKEQVALRSKPKINPFHNAFEVSSRDAKKEIWSRLYEPAHSFKKTKVELMRREKEIKEMEECSFQPRISERSKQIVGQRTRGFHQNNLSLHEQLYQEADQRQRRLDRYACWFPEHVTFKPTLSETAGRMDTSEYGDVVDRLYAKKEQATLRVERLRKEIARPYDRKTGQKYFQPVVGRGPEFRRNAAQLPIGDYMYGMRYEFDDKKEFLHTMEEQIRMDMINSVFITDRSDKLSSRLKRRIFKDIFLKLDTDGDGVIEMTEEGLHLEGLSEEIVADVQYAADCTEFKEDIDLETFQYLMEHAVEMRIVGYRAYLQPKVRGVKDDENLTFHPKINSYSQKLAQRRRQTSQFSPFESLYQDHNVNRERLDKLAKELDELRMAECTFEPKLNFVKKSNSAVYSSDHDSVAFDLSRLRDEEEEETAEFVETEKAVAGGGDA